MYLGALFLHEGRVFVRAPSALLSESIHSVVGLQIALPCLALSFRVKFVA